MLSIINKRSNIFLLLLPTRVRFLVLTPPQSPLQGENFDQFVNWQSSWQGIWHICVKGGNGPEYLRHSLMSACPPSCLRQVIAGSKKRWSLIYLFFFFFFMNVCIHTSKVYNILSENHTESPEYLYNNLIFFTSFTLNKHICHFSLNILFKIINQIYQEKKFTDNCKYYKGCIMLSTPVIPLYMLSFLLVSLTQSTSQT